MSETEERKLACDVPLEESEIKCQEEFRKCADNKSHFEDNEQKAFDLTLNEHCTRMMKNRIEEHTNFESAIWNDPLESLKRIKKNAFIANKSNDNGQRSGQLGGND